MNPSFETDVLADGVFTLSASGWTVLEGTKAGTFNPTVGQGISTDGSQVGYVAEDLTILSQTTAEVAEGDVDYTFSVDVIRRLDEPFPGYEINIVAGTFKVIGVTRAANFIATPGTSITETLSFSLTPAEAAFISGDTLEIQLLSKGEQTNYDNVQFSKIPQSCP